MFKIHAEEIHSSVPSLLQLNRERNPISHSDLQTPEQQKEFLDSFNAHKFFPDQETEILKVVALLKKTQKRKKIF